MINLVGAVQIASAAEGVALAERAGLDLRFVADGIASGQAASPQVVRNVRRFIAGDHSTSINFTPALRLKDIDYALLVGARPRSKGMERKDLLEANGAIFTGQGRALNDVAKRSVKVLVVGNPANTNAYIAMKSAPDLPRENFTAMLRLDHNRALSQLAAKSGKPVDAIEKLIVWGNHSPTMYPDYRFATIGGQPAPKVINDETWYRETFIPTVGKRGAAIIEARGLSSAATAANAAIDHMHDWALGSNGKWVTMGVPSDGSYGIPDGVMYGVPVTTAGGKYQMIKGLEIDAFSRSKMDATLKELEEERAGVSHLLK